MIKARPKYPRDLYDNIYIDNIQKVVVIFLIISSIIKRQLDMTVHSSIIKRQLDMTVHSSIIKRQHDMTVHSSIIKGYVCLIIIPAIFHFDGTVM
jgi:hypothetical protein